MSSKCTGGRRYRGPCGGGACRETADPNGHFCKEYIDAGYSCQDMMTKWNYDCGCSCTLQVDTDTYVIPEHVRLFSNEDT